MSTRQYENPSPASVILSAANGCTGTPLYMAIADSYNAHIMDVSVAEAKDRLPELIRAVEGGKKIVITRRGKPVAQLAPPPAARRPVRFGGLRQRMELLPGWDDPVSLEGFLAGDL
jgi:prevent-host-death family protein